MKLYEILVPVVSNDGKRDYSRDGTLREFSMRVLDRVGGYTIYAAVDGAWRNDNEPAPGNVYFDRNVPIRFATDDQHQHLAIVADALELFPDQKCIMSYVISDTVTFTPRVPAPERCVVCGQHDPAHKPGDC